MGNSVIQTLNISTQVIFGSAALAGLQLPPGDVVFVKSASLEGSILAPVEKILENHKGAVTRVVKPAGEPSSDDIDEAFLKISSFSSVLAIGGGSTLDFAKALALLSGSGGSITEYEFGDRKVRKVKPLYLVPTTAGTGSEVTPYTVINNANTGRKFTLNHQDLRATQAAINPTVLQMAPDDILLPTALDAFTHCLEALLTKADTQLIWPMAIKGLQIAWRRLAPEARTIGGDDYFSDLALMSLFGGISIAHSRTGLIHTCSVAFAQFCKTPHGMLNSRLLPFVLRHCLDNYGGLLQRIVSETSGTSLKNDQEAYDVLTGWLRDISGEESPLAPATIAKNKESLVTRVLQDKGLSVVCHGDVSQAGLNRLIEDMSYA